MDSRGGRRVVHGFILSLLGLFVWQSGILDLIDLHRTCWNCDGVGTGVRVMNFRPDGDTPVSFQCGVCKGTGRIPLAGENVDYPFWRICRALWSCVCLGIAGGLAWGMKLVNCRLCGGSGCLALEAQPPGESAFRVDLDCVACEGRGRLGALDRWVLRREDA
jgi:hypothetical protein